MNVRHTHRAFTLIELLLVMAIIVAMMGLGVPFVMRLYARNRLKSTTQEMQAVLYRTRLAAMKTGKAFVFRYRYNSPVYEIMPKEIFDLRKKSETGSEAFMIGTEMLEEDAQTEPEPVVGDWQSMLPHDIVFGDLRGSPTSEEGEAFMFSSDPLPDSDTAGGALGYEENFDDAFDETAEIGSNHGAALDDGWSPPILFFPNGRTSQTVLELRTENRYNFREQLFLRGLTGTAGIVEQ